jgi:hypothetical protein
LEAENPKDPFSQGKKGRYLTMLIRRIIMLAALGWEVFMVD